MGDLLSVVTKQDKPYMQGPLLIKTATTKDVATGKCQFVTKTNLSVSDILFAHSVLLDRFNRENIVANGLRKSQN